MCTLHDGAAVYDEHTKKKRRADDEKKGIGRAGRAISAYLERRAKSLPEPGIAGLI